MKRPLEANSGHSQTTHVESTRVRAREKRIFTSATEKPRARSSITQMLMRSIDVATLCSHFGTVEASRNAPAFNTTGLRTSKSAGSLKHITISASMVERQVGRNE